MKRAEYRLLSKEEINILISQGCRSDNWDGISIHPSVNLNYIHDTVFSGKIKIGKTDKVHIMPGGIPQHSGIFSSTLHNTVIGDNCLIINNHGYIANYIIGEESVIARNGNIITAGESMFGQGTALSVLCESGGREIIIHERLSSHEAYLQALYRHNHNLTARLHEAAMDEARTHSSSMGSIGAHSEITGCSEIRNVITGEYSVINGASCLDNGTIKSCKESPSFIGHNVTARDFIMLYGSSLTDACRISRCFIGRASSIGNGFTATDSFFGSNCRAENGEACAVFAGPFTVTHHKSTLLIGGMYSFFNAGSGSNQSNHMYKLGPSHQGILERGCKTASDSYILWPARIGAFSMIMGHVTCQTDVADLPFSYIIGEEGKNMIIPGIALRNVGTLRDIEKWPQRDMRTPSDMQNDFITFGAYSPLTMSRITAGKHLLEQLVASCCQDVENDSAGCVCYNNMLIRRSSAQRGIGLYDSAWHRYVGSATMDRLKEFVSYKESNTHDNNLMLTDFLAPSGPCYDKWCDIAGLIAPAELIERMCKEIEDSPSSSTHSIISSYMSLVYKDYSMMEWSWIWNKVFRPRLNNESIYDICYDIINKWEESYVLLNKAIAEDARKEFSGHSLISFGIDGDYETAKSDFEAVKGTAENNPVIKSLEVGISDAKNIAGYYIALLENFRK